jgi:hypothetical protein
MRAFVAALLPRLTRLATLDADPDRSHHTGSFESPQMALELAKERALSGPAWQAKDRGALRTMSALARAGCQIIAIEHRMHRVDRRRLDVPDAAAQCNWKKGFIPSAP